MVDALNAKIDPVDWTDVEPIGKVDTLNEAVTAWLNQHNKDLNQLTVADLQSLIKHLENLQGKSATKISGLNDLIDQLKTIQTTWRQDSGTTLDNLQRDLTCRTSVLSALTEATKNAKGVDITDALDKALTALKPISALISSAVVALNTSTQLWSANDTTSYQNIANLLTSLQTIQTDLQSKGIDTKALGLDKLIDALDTAIDAYNAAITATPNDPKAAQLALSKLRQATATAKIEYLERNGATASDPRLQAEQSIVRVEKMWQNNLTIPWSEAVEFDGVGCSEQSIKEQMAELEKQYKMLVKLGNQDGMAYVKSRLEILERSLNELRSGEPPIIVGLKLFTEVKMLEIGTKKVLMARANEAASDDPKTGRKGDPKMAGVAQAIGAEIGIIENLVDVAMQEYGGVLTKWVESSNAAIAASI